jgi:hypothetical protein
VLTVFLFVLLIWTGSTDVAGRPPLPGSSASFQQTQDTLSELKALHDLVLDDKLLADKERDTGVAVKSSRESTDDLPIHLLSSRNSRQSDQPATGMDRIQRSPQRAVSPSKIVEKGTDLDVKSATSPARGVVEDSMLVSDDELVRNLARENQQLKSEISQFDSAFFEELEDLKFRYSKLQEFVGEDPSAESDSRLSLLHDPRVKRSLAMSKHQSLSSSKTKEVDMFGERSSPPSSLTRLSWSGRAADSMMDKASHLSSLVSGPQVAHAFTYAPGAGLRTGERERDRRRGGGDHDEWSRTVPIGGSIPANKSLRREIDDDTYDLDDRRTTRGLMFYCNCGVRCLTGVLCLFCVAIE